MTNATDLYPFYRRARLDVARENAEYAQACREWRDQGYYPHYCRHGVNLWTDADSVCGACESGRSDLERAVDLAHARHDRANRMLSDALHVANLAASLPPTHPAQSHLAHAANALAGEWRAYYLSVTPS